MSNQLKPLLDALNNPSLPGIDLSLERMQRLLAALGHPEQKLPPMIHVAGTNGKGSTIAYLRSIYEAAGHQVHVYTSPHLVKFNERIVIAGHEASDAMLVPYLERVARVAKKIPVTFFEATTAAALLAFSGHKADVVLLETGLGGRLDATNIIAKPLATIITPIGFDHQEFLGNSLSAIAAEKAGIIKPGVPVFCAGQAEEAFAVLRRQANAADASLLAQGNAWNYEINAEGFKLFWSGNVWQLPAPGLQGTHQYANAALAAVTALALQPFLKINVKDVATGVTRVQWPARLQKLQHGPLLKHWTGEVWLDGGHNESAAAALVDWIASQMQPVCMIVGMMQRKDAQAFFRPFSDPPITLVCVPIPGHAAEAYTPDQLAKAAKAAGCSDVTMATSLMRGVDMLAHKHHGVLLVTGSLFLAGEILKTHG